MLTLDLSHFCASDLQDIIKKIVAGALEVNPPLTDEEIDRFEKKYKPLVLSGPFTLFSFFF